MKHDHEHGHDHITSQLQQPQRVGALSPMPSCLGIGRRTGGVRARTPTVHQCLCGGRPWVWPDKCTTRHDKDDKTKVRVLNQMARCHRETIGLSSSYSSFECRVKHLCVEKMQPILSSLSASDLFFVLCLSSSLFLSFSLSAVSLSHMHCTCTHKRDTRHCNARRSRFCLKYPTSPTVRPV